MSSLKELLVAGKALRGVWLGLGSAASAEMAMGAGFDWGLIDGEHAPYDIAVIADQARVLGPNACVRIPKARDWMIKQVLDLGLHTVVVPMVDTPEQAREMAQAMRYPTQGFPQGTRGIAPAIVRASGYNQDQSYLANANDRVCLMVQAESVTALENLEDICAVEGVDGVFIGPADLAGSMGFSHDLDATVVQEAIDDAITRIVKAGKIAGCISFDPTRAEHYLEMGATMVAVASDVNLLGTAMRGAMR